MAHLTTSKTMSSNLKSDFKSKERSGVNKRKEIKKNSGSIFLFPKNIYIHGNSNEAISDNILKHKYFWCKTVFLCTSHALFP